MAPAEVLAILKDEGIPVFSLGGLEMPLFGGIGLPVWAPINQILTTMGIVLVISAFLRYLKRRKEDSEQAGRWRNMAVVFAIAGAVVFALTQNTHNLMVLFDLWTPVHAAIFAGVLTGIRRSSYKNPVKN
jgi:formate hydrogenlyase subunit 3/multisubunit Na+/H+ antiporter MnhD subunit